MRLLKTALALFALSSAIANATAIDQFKTFVATTKSARGEFSQHQVRMTDGKLQTSRRSSGNFIFSRPGKFVWTYRKPYEQLILSDGHQVYIHDKDLNQVTIRKLGNALGSSPAAILFGNNNLEQNFKLKDAGIKQGIEWLEATPKARNGSFETIGIGMINGVPVAMELRDTFGQTTVLTLEKFERNPGLAPNQFRFSAPKGADVIQQ